MFTFKAVVAARLKSTDLPEDIDGQAVEPEPFLSGHPILPEDMGMWAFVARLIQLLTPPDIADLTQAQLYELNQVGILIWSYLLHP